MASDVNDVPFSISLIGDVSEEKWVGDFRAKKTLSHRDQLKRDQIRRELLGSQGGAPTERALSIAMVLSELAVRITKAPKWWAEKGEGLDLEDSNVIGEVYDNVTRIEREAAEAKKVKAEKAQEEMREEAKKADADK